MSALASPLRAVRNLSVSGLSDSTIVISLFGYSLFFFLLSCSSCSSCSFCSPFFGPTPAEFMHPCWFLHDRRLASRPLLATIGQMIGLISLSRYRQSTVSFVHVCAHMYVCACLKRNGLIRLFHSWFGSVHVCAVERVARHW